MPSRTPRASPQGGVVLSVEDVKIPTYPIPQPDRNPMLFDREWTDIYPYSLKDDLQLDRRTRNWKAVRIENRYTEVTVLPGLGGHVWGAYDKAAGHEIFYRNHSIKPGLILLSGAWIPTGIEFNFPCGHNVTTVSPVDWHTRRLPDGSAAVIVGNTERVQRMRWQVAVRLRPDRSYIETVATLENRTALPQRYYYWANSAVNATPELQYVSAADWIISWGGVQRFPVNEKGVKVSFYKNHRHANDMFSVGDENDFFGGYDCDLERGLCHVADSAQVAGKKFFTWGTSEGGLIWATMLTDSDGPYVELQAGIFQTQGDFGWLMPGEALRFKEYWYSVNGTGGFRFANESVLANYSVERPPSRGRILSLRLNATRELRASRVLVECGGRRILDRRADIVPGAPAALECRLPAAFGGEEELLFTVLDSSGNRLARWAGKRPKGGSISGKPPLRHRLPETPAEGARAEDMLRAARLHASHKQYSRAWQCLERCLRAEPGNFGALSLKALLLLYMGDWKAALDAAAKAVEREPDAAEPSYYEGLACRELGLAMRAKLAFQRAAKTLQWRAASETRLAEMALAAGRPERALDLLRRARAGSSDAPRTRALEAVALRVAGRSREALRALEGLLADEPTELLGQAEAYLCERSAAARKRMEKALRGEVQSYLELACEYMGLGLLGDALEMVHEGVRTAADPGATACYYAAYLSEKLGARGRSRRELTGADKASLERQFPHRHEEEKILRWAISARPRDCRARYLLGNLLAARRRRDEAAALWKEAARGLPRFSVVHRNLGLLLWKVRQQPRKALEHYRRALRAAPGDHKLYTEADRLLGELGLSRERLRLYRAAKPLVEQHAESAEQMAVMLVDTGRYREAVEFMHSHVFKPWEGGYVMHHCYMDAFIGLARAALARGDKDEAVKLLLRSTDFPEQLHIGKPKELSSAEALYELGLLAGRMGDRKAARGYMERAAVSKERFPCESTYYAALACRRLGRARRAKQILKWLLDAAESGFIGWSRDTPAQRSFLKGLALDGMGRRTDARAAWRKAVKLCRGHAGAKRMLSRGAT